MLNAHSFFATLLAHTTMLTIPPTIPSFTSVNFHLPFSSHYLFTKPSLQTLATLPSSIRQPFLAFLFSHIVIITIPTKNHFPYLDHQASSGFVSRVQWTREPCVAWQGFNSSLLPRSMDRDKSAHNQWFFVKLRKFVENQSLLNCVGYVDCVGSWVIWIK